MKGVAYCTPANVSTTPPAPEFGLDYFDNFPDSTDIATLVNLLKSSVAMDDAGNYRVTDRTKMKTLMESMVTLDQHCDGASLAHIASPKNTSPDKKV